MTTDLVYFRNFPNLSAKKMCILIYTKKVSYACMFILPIPFN